MADEPQDDQTGRFLRLITTAETHISRYIFVLTADIDVAQDIYQETVLDLWQKFHLYDPSRPFVYWACRFAYIHVQRWRRAKGRSTAIRLDDQVMEMLSDEYLAARAELDQRRAWLAKCLEKLPLPARRLLDQCYTQRQTVQDIARKNNRSARSLYHQMGNIRHWLKDCIERQMSTGVT